jgi:glutaredoxin
VRPAALLIAFAAVAAVAGGSGCKKPKPAAPSAAESALPPLEVKKDGSWLYTYVEPTGQFATIDKADAVPEASRRLVRVIDPSRAAHERRDTTSVYVVDLGELLARGKVTAKVMSRLAFETGALALLPPGESSLLADRPPPGTEPPLAAGDLDAGAAIAGAGAGKGGAAGDVSAAVVTLYGTSWCGACREARKYLASRKIPFADKDVERDPAAARELGQKAARLGIRADRVPILDVRGRLLIGFDRARLEALLGDPS